MIALLAGAVALADVGPRCGPAYVFPCDDPAQYAANEGWGTCVLCDASSADPVCLEGTRVDTCLDTADSDAGAFVACAEPRGGCAVAVGSPALGLAALGIAVALRRRAR